jgi:hypothetical protein
VKKSNIDWQVECVLRARLRLWIKNRDGSGSSRSLELDGNRIQEVFTRPRLSMARKQLWIDFRC